MRLGLLTKPIVCHRPSVPGLRCLQVLRNQCPALVPAPAKATDGDAHWPPSVPSEPDCAIDGRSPGCRWDESKETRRRNSRRTVFGFDDWKRHRSNDRFYKNVKNMLVSGVMKGITVPIAFVIALTYLVALYNHAFGLGHLPAWVPPPPVISYQSLGITSMALSLLLVFRTNASYARWGAAKSAFSSIIKGGCNIGRQAFYWFRRDDMARKTLLLRWVVALAKTCRCHVTTPDVEELRKTIGDTLTAEETEMLIKSSHSFRPSFCLQMITEIVHTAGLSDIHSMCMDNSIGSVASAISECEGILYHPIPLSYTRHTGRFLWAWMACLPFTLWSISGWTMVPVMALVAFVLLGIEEIGVYIEEPFSILPLDFMSEKLEKMVGAMFHDHLTIKERLASILS